MIKADRKPMESQRKPSVSPKVLKQYLAAPGNLLTLLSRAFYGSMVGTLASAFGEAVIGVQVA